MFIKIVERASTIINYISVWCIFALMVIGIIAILMRLVGAPLSGVITSSVFILVISLYLSFAYTQLRKGHVNVELLVLRISARPRLILLTITTFLSAVACLFLVWASWPNALESLMTREFMHGEPFPIYPAKLSIAVGTSFLFLQIIADFLKTITLFKGGTKNSRTSEKRGK